MRAERAPAARRYLTDGQRLSSKARYLTEGERILEWKLGRVSKWRVDQNDMPLPGLYGLERMSLFPGLTDISYSSRWLFLMIATGLLAVDLGLIWYLEPTGHRSLSIVYSTIDAVSSIHFSSLRWKSDEMETGDAIAGFAARIRARGDERRSQLSPVWREWAVRRPLELDATGVLESELAELAEEPRWEMPALHDPAGAGSGWQGRMPAALRCDPLCGDDYLIDGHLIKPEQPAYGDRDEDLRLEYLPGAAIARLRRCRGRPARL